MTSILFVIEIIYRNQFKCNYLRKQKAFPQLFAGFLKSTSKFQHFEKKDEPHSCCNSEIRDYE